VKFLVMWELDLARLSTGVLHAVMRMPDYAQEVIDRGKLEARYHIVGKHGGAWIYDVTSNEELEQLLAMAPVYNFARYDVYPLAEMETPADILRASDEQDAPED
jgi:muconolactone delta-isomerase